MTDKKIPHRTATQKKRFLFAQPPAEALTFLNNFDTLIQEIRPLTGKQFRELPKDIRELSHQLTDDRSSRRKGYMNGAAGLSAYARYFLPWNLFRLTRVFSAMDETCFAPLEDGGVLLDLGSGPLTVPIALWLSRPELRAKKLTFYCTDISQTALSLGEEIFLSACAHTIGEPWKIVRVKDSFGVVIRQKADFVFCVNLCNELYLDTPSSLEEQAQKIAAVLLDYGGERSRFFIGEPGIPRSSRFISLLRAEFLSRGLQISLPCPHEGRCPMPANRGGKWCHFVLDTQAAPKSLRTLSEAAGLPKERAAISLLFASRPVGEKKSPPVLGSKETLTLRIISELIRLPYDSGRYACSSLGLTLATGKIRSLVPGTLLEIPLVQEKAKALSRDKKSGALIVTI